MRFTFLLVPRNPVYHVFPLVIMAPQRRRMPAWRRRKPSASRVEMTAAPYAYFLIAIALTALVVVLVRHRQGSHDGDRETRLIVENIPGFAWSAGPDGGIRYLNQHVLEFTGKRSEDLKRIDGMASLGWAEVIHPEDLDRKPSRQQQPRGLGGVSAGP
jgi:PAS domain-containing protein